MLQQPKLARPTTSNVVIGALDNAPSYVDKPTVDCRVTTNWIITLLSQMEVHALVRTYQSHWLRKSRK